MKQFALLILMLIEAACSTLTKQEVARREDYGAALHEFTRGSPQRARAMFPNKEKGSFITSIEKYWLDLLSGAQPDPRPLLAIAEKLEDRMTVKLSAEIGSLIYKEDSGRYYPAEHEAVLLHMVLATGFLKAQKFNEARVALRRAARYLQSHYGPNRKAFDDPTLRVWLASLWMAAGEWESARVDLRVAAKLAPDAAWIQALAQRPTPPRTLHLVFAGAGPHITWEPLSTHAPNPLASLRFHPSTKPEPMNLIEGKQSLPFPAPLPTIRWFDQHQKKSSALHEVLQGSRYLGEGLATTTVSSANYVGASLLAGFTLAAGVGGGLGLAIAIGDDLGIGLGIAVAATGYQASKNLYSEAEKRSRKWLEEGLGELEYYRFVRFLPDYLYLLPGTGSGQDSQVTFASTSKRPLLQLPNPNQTATLHLYHASTAPAASLKVIEVPAHFYVNSRKSILLHSRPVSYTEAVSLCAQFKFQGISASLLTEDELKDFDGDAFTRMLYPREFVQRASAAKDQFWTLHESILELPGKGTRPFLCKFAGAMSLDIQLFEQMMRDSLP